MKILYILYDVCGGGCVRCERTIMTMTMQSLDDVRIYENDVSAIMSSIVKSVVKLMLIAGRKPAPARGRVCQGHSHMCVCVFVYFRSFRRVHILPCL